MECIIDDFGRLEIKVNNSTEKFAVKAFIEKENLKKTDFIIKEEIKIGFKKPETKKEENENNQ